MTYRQLEHRIVCAFAIGMLALAAYHSYGVYRTVRASVQQRLTVIP